MGHIGKHVFSLWVLVVAPVLIANADGRCTTATPEECKTYKFIPGVSSAANGFDITTMSQKQYPIIQMTTAPGKTCIVCQNSHQHQDFQKLPDVFTDWTTIDQCHRKIGTTNFPSSAEVVASLGKWVKNNWALGLRRLPRKNTKEQLVYVGSQSGEAKFANNERLHDKYSFTKHEVHCSYYKYGLKRDIPLEPMFLSWLKRLKHPYNSQNKAVYQELLQLYGTHYIHRGELGGHAEEVTALKTCELSLDGLTVDEVGDCLWSEASTQVFRMGTKTTRHEVCRKAKQRLLSNGLFSRKYDERFVKATSRSSSDISLLFMGSESRSEMLTWMKNLKKEPDVISYSLTPIHELVNFSPTIKKDLKMAITDYIRTRAFRRKCLTCPKDTMPSPLKPCTCLCQQNAQITQDCCPKKRGLAMLTVQVKKGEKLYGDVISQTDGFVKACLGKRCLQTDTIDNNDNPNWNYTMSFGPIGLSPKSKLEVNIFDQDYLWAEKLGSCTEALVKTNGFEKKICYLKHGKIFYDTNVECGPYLTGLSCSEHKASYH
ncbi:perforin-1-like [Lissotriton helveticus]